MDGFYPLLLLSGKSWTPKQLSSIVGWYSADYGVYQDNGFTTPAVNDNDPVGGVTDKSGGSFHPTQATAGDKPALKLNQLAGKRSILFNGTTDFLSVTSSTNIQMKTGVTLAAVFRTSSSTGNPVICWKDSQVGNTGYLLRLDATGPPAGSLKWFISSGASVYTSILVAANYADGNWHRVVGQWDGVNINLRVDGVDQTPVALSHAVQANTNNFSFGSANGTIQFFNGDIPQAILCNAPLSSSDLSRLDTYLKNYYQL